jgi:hypothetical protein
MRLTVSCQYQVVDSKKHSTGGNAAWLEGTLQWHQGRVLLLSSPGGGVLSECVPQAAMNSLPGQVVKMHSHSIRAHPLAASDRAALHVGSAGNNSNSATAKENAPIPRPIGVHNNIAHPKGNIYKNDAKMMDVQIIDDHEDEHGSGPKSIVHYDCRYLLRTEFELWQRKKSDIGAAWTEGVVTYDEGTQMASFRDAKTQRLLLNKHVPSSRMREGQLLGLDSPSRHVIEILGKSNIQSDREAEPKDQSIVTYAMVYTQDKHKKQRKRWLDGTMTWNPATCRALFYSALPDDDNDACNEGGEEDSDDQDGRFRKMKRQPQVKKGVRLLLSRVLDSGQVHDGAEIDAAMYQFVLNEPFFTGTVTEAGYAKEGPSLEKSRELMTAKQYLVANQQLPQMSISDRPKNPRSNSGKRSAVANVQRTIEADAVRTTAVGKVGQLVERGKKGEEHEWEREPDSLDDLLPDLSDLQHHSTASLFPKAAHVPFSS